MATVTERGPTAADTSSARSLHLVSVVTPEGVVLSFRAAGVASRMLAKVIDLFIQFVALILVIIIAASLAFESDTLATIVLLVLVFLVFYGYSAVSETWFGGRTVGKLAMGIRVITTEGGPVKFRHATIRSLLWTFDFFLPTPGGLVALAFALLTPRSQRLGDLAAGTIVIRDTKAQQHPVFFPPPYGAEGVVTLLDTSRFQSHHYTLVREFLLRAHELLPPARASLAEDMANRVAVVTGNDRPAGLDGERYLVSVMSAHQRRFSDEGWSAAPPPPTAPPAGPWSAPVAAGSWPAPYQPQPAYQPAGYGAPPPAQPAYQPAGYGAPPPAQPVYQRGGYGTPPPPQPGGYHPEPLYQPGGYGTPPPPQPGAYGGPQGPQPGGFRPPRPVSLDGLGAPPGPLGDDLRDLPPPSGPPVA